jgi:hypothetical protein
MNKRNKSILDKGKKILKKTPNNSYESVMDELYYSHLMELLFDHGSGNAQFKENQKKRKIKRTINKITKTKGA